MSHILRTARVTRKPAPALDRGHTVHIPQAEASMTPLTMEQARVLRVAKMMRFYASTNPCEEDRVQRTEREWLAVVSSMPRHEVQDMDNEFMLDKYDPSLLVDREFRDACAYAGY